MTTDADPQADLRGLVEVYGKQQARQLEEDVLFEQARHRGIQRFHTDPAFRHRIHVIANAVRGSTAKGLQTMSPHSLLFSVLEIVIASDYVTQRTEELAL